MLIRRENQPFKGKWCFPGGKIEPNENYIDACKREIYEETGINIKLPEIHLLKIVYVEDFIIFSTISELINEKVDILLKKEFTHDNIISKWFNLEEISKLDEIFNS